MSPTPRTDRSRPAITIADLEPGDVLLFSPEKGSLISDAIVLLTGADVSHAALALDPAFAPARAHLAALFGQRVQIAGLDAAWADSGVAAAQRAIDMAPNRPEGYKEMALNLALLGRYDEARGHILRAIELNPSSADAMQNLGVAELRAARHDEAVVWLERARRISPGHIWVLVALAETYAQLGLWDEVRTVLASASPTSPETLLLRASSLHFDVLRDDVATALSRARELVARAPTHPWVLTEAIVIAQAAGEPAEALPWAERLHQLAPGFRYVDSGKTAGLVLAGVLADAGRDPERVAALLEAEEARSQEELRLPGAAQGPALSLAEIAARRGHVAQAMAFLAQAYDRGYRMARWLEHDSGFARLRQDPEFRRLIARMDADMARARERLGKS